MSIKDVSYVCFFQYDLDTLMRDSVTGAVVTGALGISGVWSIVQFFIGGAIELGMCSYFMKLALMRKTKLADEFAYFDYFWKALTLRILVNVFTVLWTLLLIVPGIMATYSYSLAPYEQWQRANDAGYDR